jgi:hypothetical protein
VINYLGFMLPFVVIYKKIQFIHRIVREFGGYIAIGLGVFFIIAKPTLCNASVNKTFDLYNNIVSVIKTNLLDVQSSNKQCKYTLLLITFSPNEAEFGLEGIYVSKLNKDGVLQVVNLEDANQKTQITKIVLDDNTKNKFKKAVESESVVMKVKVLDERYFLISLYNLHSLKVEAEVVKRANFASIDSIFRNAQLPIKDGLLEFIVKNGTIQLGVNIALLKGGDECLKGVPGKVHDTTRQISQLVSQYGLIDIEQIFQTVDRVIKYSKK